ncbi:MAG: Fic family protein [Methanomassiliicoccaceae archaeon]|nr:Fic family protein [Methanomassiliicoccaceae archaeon]
MPYKPLFDIDNEMLDLVSDIAVLIGRVKAEDVPSRHLKLRRTNRIRSIQSSLAIEGSSLSLENVTDIIEGKRVIGNPREIQEVKSAVAAYDLIDNLNPYSVDDLLKAHGKMAFGLIGLPGRFRKCGVGVYKGNVAIHIAPDHEDVPRLIEDLMDWAESSDVHPLIKSCIFHCRFEFIHPFEDGNGRMGRLWQSLILSKWKPLFAYLPIESWVKLNQKEYYNSLMEADKENIEVFIKYMLRMIFTAVDEFVDEITYSPKNMQEREKAILEILSKEPQSTASEIAGILSVSDRTIKRHLSSLTEKGIIRRVGSDKTGHWEILR